MANFLITSPDTLAQGTDENDLFDIRTALLNTIRGGGGNDFLTANTVANLRSTFQGGPGLDTIQVNANFAPFNSMFVGGGAGADLIVVSSFTNALASTINGGGGSDTIAISGILTFGSNSGVTINGNAGNDLMVMGIGDGTGYFVAGGGGNDTMNVSANIDRLTIAGGGGADFISGQIGAGGFLANSSLRIEADTLGDSEFFGNDTVTVGGTIGSGAFINGGGGADSLRVSAALGNDFTIGGGQGRDTILVSANVATTGFINGGAAADVITVSGAGGANLLINGGGGFDTIGVTNNAFSGAIAGGTEADKFDLASASATILRYNAAADLSTISNLDFASSNVAAANGRAFTISQDVIGTGVIGAGGNANVTIAAGVATFVPGFNGELSARIAQLDRILTRGSVASFQDGGGNSYVFIQAGASTSGIEGDFVLRTDKQAANFVVNSTGTTVLY